MGSVQNIKDLPALTNNSVLSHFFDKPLQKHKDDKQ